MQKRNVAILTQSPLFLKSGRYIRYSRAWCLYGIAQTLPKYHHLKEIALKHINYSLPTIADANYEGEHWLASFAIYALNCKKAEQKK